MKKMKPVGLMTRANPKLTKGLPLILKPRLKR